MAYANKGGAVVNLPRDDLGMRASTPLTCDVGDARGIVAGEYAVNLHLDRNAAGGARSRRRWGRA
ncbi:MAG: hypothetical protein ACLFU0_04710 [Alphaproteobacteria bacterium]